MAEVKKSSSNTVTDLTQGNIWKQLIFFALPFLFSNLLQTFYSTADAAIVGQKVGSGALAAIGSCDRLIYLLTTVFLGISTGASITVAQAFGSQNIAKLRRIIHSTIAVSVISGAFLLVLGEVTAKQFLLWMNTPAEVLPYALNYIRVYFLGMIPVMIYNMGSGILRALGNSRTTLIYLGFAGIINVGLDIIFILGLNWGIRGAAAATAISQILPAVLVLRKLTTLDESYALRFPSIRIHLAETSEIIRVGVPAGLRMAVVTFSITIVQARLNAFGLGPMAGCTLFFKVESYLYALISATSLALTSFAGQNIGAGKYHRVLQGKRISMIIAAVVTAVLCFLFIVWPEIICRIFTTDETAIAYGALQLRYQLPLYIIFSWNEIVNGVVLSSGKSIIPMTISIFGMCVARLSFIFIVSAFFYDVRVVYLAFPFSWIVTAICINTYYFFGKWANGKKFSAALAEEKAALKEV